MRKSMKRQQIRCLKSDHSQFPVAKSSEMGKAVVVRHICQRHPVIRNTGLRKPEVKAAITDHLQERWLGD